MLINSKIVLTAKPLQPAKRPIQVSPKVSIQPKPLITTMPIAHAAAPLQTKTIIIQPLQTTVLPVVKPPPVTIQPAPPTGEKTSVTYSATLKKTKTYYKVLCNTIILCIHILIHFYLFICKGKLSQVELQCSVNS